LIRHRKLAKEGDVSYSVRTDYHVIFSETWQVPVLYFLSTWTKTMDPLSLKEIYSVLVESSTKAALEDVGVMGGISHGVFSMLVRL
jgi:Autophagocytosis associated protein, active-site domain